MNISGASTVEQVKQSALSAGSKGPGRMSRNRPYRPLLFVKLCQSSCMVGGRWMDLGKRCLVRGLFSGLLKTSVPVVCHPYSGGCS